MSETAVLVKSFSSLRGANFVEALGMKKYSAKK